MLRNSIAAIAGPSSSNNTDSGSFPDPVSHASHATHKPRTPAAEADTYCPGNSLPWGPDWPGTVPCWGCFAGKISAIELQGSLLLSLLLVWCSMCCAPK